MAVQPLPLPLTAGDGRPLGASIFHADGPRRGAVAMLPALAVPARFYRPLASHLAALGYDVLTFDPRGMGESRRAGRMRDEPATLTDWVQQDYRAAMGWLGAQPGPHLVVGHSLGGQVIALLDELCDLDGVYAVGAQLAYWRRFPTRTRYAMLAAFRLMPRVAQAVGYLPAWSGFGADVPKGVILEWCRWLQSPGYLLDHVDDAAARMARNRSPVVMLGFTDDTYAPRAGVEAMAACLPASRTEVRIVDPAEWGLDRIGHFGGFRPYQTDAGKQPHPLWAHILQHLNRWSDAAAAPNEQTG